MITHFEENKAKNWLMITHFEENKAKNWPKTNAYNAIYVWT